MNINNYLFYKIVKYAFSTQKNKLLVGRLAETKNWTKALKIVNIMVPDFYRLFSVSKVSKLK